MSGLSEEARAHQKDLQEKKSWDNSSKSKTSNLGIMVDGTTITGIKVPFWDVFKVMVQIGIAAIPVGIVVGVVYLVVGGFFAGIMR